MSEFFRILASHAALNRLAIVDPPRSPHLAPVQYTYAQILSRVTVFREHLIEKAQQSRRCLKGARIGLMVPPGVDFVVAVLSIWSVHAILVPICLTHPVQEITYTVSDSDQDLIIYNPTFYPKVQSLLKNRVGVNVTDISKDDTSERTIDFSALDWEADAPSTILYTSGTTGLPKGAVQSHDGAGQTTQSLAKAWQFTPEDRVLHVLPLHHGHGLNLSLLLPLWVGATVEFMSKFDEAQVWQRFLASHQPQITVFMAVPTIWVKLIRHFDEHLAKDTEMARRASNAAASLRLAISGSAALPEPVRNAWAEISQGYLLLERYGTTETGIIYSGQLRPNGRILGSVGWPVPGIETRVIADDGKDVSKIPDAIGEIQVKTKGLVKEYWGKPGTMAKEMTSDGWYKTGDLAMIKAEHDNALFIQGRASVDIIKSGGYKISALDVEQKMLELPFVQEVAVVAKPDPVWGEMVAAICAPVSGRANELTIANVREKMRDKLAPYKLPQALHVVDAIPRNAMGKVQKKELIAQCFHAPRMAKL